QDDSIGAGHAESMHRVEQSIRAVLDPGLRSKAYYCGRILFPCGHQTDPRRLGDSLRVEERDAGLLGIGTHFDPGGRRLERNPKSPCKGGKEPVGSELLEGPAD